jgi:hypothetical protein
MTGNLFGVEFLGEFLGDVFLFVFHFLFVVGLSTYILLE